MAFNMNYNFITHHGLKVRLNAGYFYCQLTQSDQPVTEQKLTDNEKMNSAISCVESMFCLPTALVQLFSIFAAIFHFDILVFCGICVALYMFGCLWRCCKQDYVLNFILFLWASAYAYLRYLVYVALIILFFALKSTYLIVPYIVVRAFLALYELFQNRLILSYTRKKYGVPFNDTEICAFRVFKYITKTDGSMTDYIKDYLSTVE